MIYILIYYIWGVETEKAPNEFLAVLSYLHIQKLETCIFYVGPSKIFDLQNFPPPWGGKVEYFFSPRLSSVN